MCKEATCQVDHITSTPPTAIVSSSVDLAAGSVSVVVAPGVTQVVLHQQTHLTIRSGAR